MTPFRKRRPDEEALDDLAALSDEALARFVLPRLVLTADVPAELHPTAPTFVPGLSVLLAVRLRLSKTVIPPEWVWDQRGGVEHWRAIALRNVTALFDDLETEHRQVPFDGVSISTFMGQSTYVASLALRFGDLMRHLGVVDRGAGFLVAVPSRQQILWRVIEGNENARLVESLVTITHDFFRGAPDRRVSPLVYWVRGDDWRPVTRLEEDGVRVLLPDELIVAMGLA